MRLAHRSIWLALSLAVLAPDAWAWQANVTGTVLGHDEAFAVAVDGAGDVVAAGYTVNAGGGQEFTVVKFSGVDGAEIWRAVIHRAPGVFGGGGASAVAVDAADDIVAVGAMGRTSLDGDFFVVKLSSADGAELWRAMINGSANRDDAALAVALDGAGDVVAAGLTTNTDTDADFTVLKFSGTDGAEMWRQSINGSAAFSADRVWAVSVDLAGDVAAAGGIQNVGTHWDFAVVKLSGADGSEQWRQVIAGLADARDEAVSVEVDGAGNVVAGGTMDEVVTFGTFTTAKFSGTDGTELWRKGFVGAGNCSGQGSCPIELSGVTVDPAGDVIAAGESELGLPIWKLSGADGAVVWSSLIGLVGSSAIVADAAGDVVSVGTSFVGSGAFNVIKFSGSSGSVIWRRDILGTQGSNGAHAVALSSSGDVVAAGYTRNLATASDFTVIELSGTDGAAGLEALQLTVTKSGAGSGAVSSVPASVDCGSTCQASFERGSYVTLNATPAPGSVFVGWGPTPSGDCSVAGSCLLYMSDDTTVTAIFELATPAPLRIGASSHLEGEVGVVFDVSLRISGGRPPYAVRVVSDALPPGLGLTLETITGTPTAAGAKTFTVEVTDQLGASTKSRFKCKVYQPISIRTAVLRTGAAGKVYKARLKASGGKKRLIWSLVSGTLPQGLTFDSATGKIAGKPTATANTDLTFQVSDPLGGQAQKILSLTIK